MKGKRIHTEVQLGNFDFESVAVEEVVAAEQKELFHSKLEQVVVSVEKYLTRTASLVYDLA